MGNHRSAPFLSLPKRKWSAPAWAKRWELGGWRRVFSMRRKSHHNMSNDWYWGTYIPYIPIYSHVFYDILIYFAYFCPYINHIFPYMSNATRILQGYRWNIWEYTGYKGGMIGYIIDHLWCLGVSENGVYPKGLYLSRENDDLLPYGPLGAHPICR